MTARRPRSTRDLHSAIAAAEAERAHRRAQHVQQLRLDAICGRASSRCLSRFMLSGIWLATWRRTMSGTSSSDHGPKDRYEEAVRYFDELRRR
jgi:hypothetical protein